MVVLGQEQRGFLPQNNFLFFDFSLAFLYAHRVGRNLINSVEMIPNEIHARDNLIGIATILNFKLFPFSRLIFMHVPPFPVLKYRYLGA